MHENWCNQVPSKKSQTNITFSKSSSDETACGCCCESCYRRSCNCYRAKRKNNLLIKSKKRKKFVYVWVQTKMKVLKNLNNGQFAAYNVADKDEIHNLY